MTTTRYLLDSDDDGHWYLIPELEHPAFGDYVASDGAGDFPPGVLSLGSHPSTVTFEAPQHFGWPVASPSAADHQARLAAGTEEG